MPLGTSIFLMAVGAILRYAVTVGLILMIAGAAGVVLALLYMLTWRTRLGQVERERIVERDPY